MESTTTRVCNDADTGIGIGDTGISLPTPIPICGIADMTILKKYNYYALLHTINTMYMYYFYKIKVKHLFAA